MLWYKAWLETRWRFLLGLLVLGCSGAVAVLEYPRVVQLIGQMGPVTLQGDLGRRVQEALSISRQYRGYVWSQAICQNLLQTGVLFAALLGTGGLLQFSKGAALFTLSLPVSRRRLIGVRAITGLAQWLLLTGFSLLLIPLLSPAIGQHFALVDALAFGLCLFTGGAVFFGLAMLLSTWFGDVWRPLLLTLLLAVVAAIPAQIDPRLARFTLSGVMNGESYFQYGRLPWLGLLLAGALTTALLLGATRHFADRDF